VLTVAGLAALLTASPTLFALLQLAAAGYLVYLARGALPSPRYDPTTTDGGRPAMTGPSRPPATAS
jgi:threonine/homoserine/homoserine lactone efflux protein